MARTSGPMEQVRHLALVEFMRVGHYGNAYRAPARSRSGAPNDWASKTLVPYLPRDAPSVLESPKVACAVNTPGFEAWNLLDFHAQPQCSERHLSLDLEPRRGEPKCWQCMGPASVVAVAQVREPAAEQESDRSDECSVAKLPV